MGTYSGQLTGKTGPGGYGETALFLGSGQSGTISSSGQYTGGSGDAGGNGGGRGVDLQSATLTNDGTITGGAGGAGNSSSNYYGGGGAAGLSMTTSGVPGSSASQATNDGTITGGNGGAGGNGVAAGGVGGSGGSGVYVGAGSGLINDGDGTITGGTGGNGGSGYAAGRGGSGGGGVALNGGSLSNDGIITGGAGGNGGAGTQSAGAASTGGSGGSGGNGVYLENGASAFSDGTIRGGNGGNGGSAYSQVSGSGGGSGGIGGIGVDLADGSLTNGGSIRGGNGGNGGASYAGHGGGAGIGGNGAELAAGSSLTNDDGGSISGGAGGTGGTEYGPGGTGGVGGTGVDLSGGSLINHGSISGGTGGIGNGGPGVTEVGGIGGSGGVGGIGVDLTGGSFSNDGTIGGGAGGTGGGGGPGGGGDGAGGTGGIGLVLADGGSQVNGGSIIGGVGGAAGTGGAYAASGGIGGAGAEVENGGTLTNDGSISGGSGASGGVSTDPTDAGGAGGNGGDGVALSGGNLINDGVISGGAGGAGGSGNISGTQGAGGIGVDITGSGTLTNAGTINGGIGAGGVQADAVHFGAGDSRLIIESGAVFNGKVETTGSDNTLELGASGGNGSFGGSSIGSEFIGFDHLQVDSGATWDLTGTTTLASSVAVENDGTISESGSDSLTVNGAISGTGTIELDPTTLTLDGSVGSGQTIDFAGSGDTLVLGDVADFHGKLSGFNSSDHLDLSGVGGATGADFNDSTGVLTIHTSGGDITLDFADPGSFNGDYFHVTSDGSGGTTVTEDTTPCYCPGTLILTDKGEVPVEALNIGDLVITHSGAAKPIRWIGRRSYAGRFLSGKPHILPVRIKAGALGENSPRRDLLLSPLHAMYIDGVLIPAGELVNGVSIVQEAVDEVHYLHIELDRHDLIWAEGSASETFIDDGGRMVFHNAEEYFRLYPQASNNAPAQYCAPRINNGYQLEAVRRQLAQRAGLTTATAEAELIGAVDHIGSDEVRGWAQNPAHPDAPQCLEVLADGRVIGMVLANQYRPKLQAAGGSGCHGFVLHLPQGIRGHIEVRRAMDGCGLPVRLAARAA